MRISMFGKSGSGKTTYMCALHEVMIENDFEGFSILPHTDDNKDDGLEAIGMLEKISFCRNGQNVQFPQGTEATTSWSFDLQYKNKNLCRLDWIDYRGGQLNEIFEGETEARVLKELIYASNAIIIFIDAIDVALNDDINLCRRITGADKLTLLLKDYDRTYANEDTIILIALSKCDSSLIPDKYKRNNYEYLINKCRGLFNSVLRLKSDNSKWRIGIMPVSAVGYGNTRSSKEQTNDMLQPYKISCDLQGFPSPINVAEAFLFCIKEIINVSKKHKTDEVSSWQNRITEEFDSATLLDTIWSAVTRQESHYVLAQKLNANKLISERTISRLDKVVKLIEQTEILEKVYIL